MASGAMPSVVNWRTPQFRQNVCHKINETMVRSPVLIRMNVPALEAQIFAKAKSEDEYLTLVLRLINHIKALGLNKSGGMAKQQPKSAPKGLQPSCETEFMRSASNSQLKLTTNQYQSEMVQNQQSTVQQGMPQHQSEIGTIMCNVFHQKIEQQPSQMISQEVRDSSGQKTVEELQMQKNVVTHELQFPNSQVVKKVQVILPKLEVPKGSQANCDLIPNQTQPNLILSQQQRMDGQIRQTIQQQGTQYTVFESNRPQQFFTLVQQQNPRQQQTQPQQANQINSPIPAQGLRMVLISSPLSLNPINVQVGPRRIITAYRNLPGSSQTSVTNNSPGGNVINRIPCLDVISQNVPARPTLNTQVPFKKESSRNSQDPAIYEKIMELQKYKSLLEKCIENIGDKDDEKSKKMVRMLQLLSNSNEDISLELLLKCEGALKMMEKKCYNSKSFSDNATLNNKLIAAVQQMQYAILSTLKRGPSSDASSSNFGPKIPKFNAPLTSETQVNDSDSSSDGELNNDIPITLVKELQFLDKKYGFTLKRNNGTMVSLIIYIALKDPQLPKVSPLKLVVSKKYPLEKPTLLNFCQEHEISPFFQAVTTDLKFRLSSVVNQPILTVTEILTFWEMSVRQAASSLYKTSKNLVRA